MLKTKILTIILIILLCFGIVYGATVFNDDFESGDLSAWSSNVNDSGDLSAHADAAMNGSYGLKVVMDDQTAIYCKDTSPSAEARYRLRFYVDPNGLTMVNGEDQSIFQAVDAVDDAIFKIRFIYHTTELYRINVMTKEDGGWSYSNDYTISDAPHYIELDWLAATGVGQNDGSTQFWIDGVSKETFSNLDNDTKAVTDCYLGALANITANTEGTFYLDEFVSNDDGTEIGAVPEGRTDLLFIFGDF